MSRRIRVRAAVGGGLVAASVLLAGLPVPAATAATTARSTKLPPPPPCATSIATSDGKRTSAPAPLPPPSSRRGGDLLAAPGLHVSPGVPAPAPMRATAWIVADLGTGSVLAACNAHVPLAPASTLKVLTAVALHGRIDRARRYTAQPADAAIDGTKVGLSPGSVYTVDNLWHGLLMGSGNDTANALASLAGGTAEAAQIMTSTARSLGAADTVVRNTSGLDAPGQVTSVYDLAIFGRALLRDRALATIVGTKLYAFPNKGKVFGRKRPTYQIQNHDLLLFSYPGATGIKNGYTRAAGASFVGSATRNGHSYVVALLKTDVNSWRLAGELLTWAFAHGTQAAPVGVLDPTPVTAQAPPPAGGSPSPSPLAPGQSTASGAQVANAVTGPVTATLSTLPTGSRVVWLVTALGLALAGGAVVSRIVRRRTAPARAGSGAGRSAGGRPAARSGSAASGRSKGSSAPRTRR